MQPKYETIIDEFGIWRLGISLGTVYSLDYNQRIKLSNFGYCFKTGEFYCNNNIHLRNRIIKYFNGKIINNELSDKLSELGIYNRESYDQEISDYKEKVEETEKARQRVITKAIKKIK